MLTPSVPLPERPDRPAFHHATLRGRGHGERGLVAIATLLGESDGRLTLHPDLLTAAGRLARQSEDNWQEVIVIAQSGPSALLLPMPQGLKLVGVVSEQEMPIGLQTPIPTISGVVGAREQIVEGSLVLLDPARGRVLVEPDAKDVAALQAGTHRARFRVGVESVTAITQGGRAVTTLALVREKEEVEAALLSGADGLYIPSSSELVAPLAEEDTNAAMKSLMWLADAFGGGHLTLSLTTEMFAPVLLARVATVSLLQVALSSSELPLPAADIRFELEKVVEQEKHAGRAAALFGLAALAPDLASPEISDFDVLYLGAEAVAALEPEMLFSLPPIYALFDNPFDDSLIGFTETIQAGASGVVVPPHRVMECKDLIREVE